MEQACAWYESAGDGLVVVLIFGADEIRFSIGLPYKNTDKFSLDDSALWETDEDVMARLEHDSR